MAKPKKGKQKNETVPAVSALPIQEPISYHHTSPANPSPALPPLPPPAHSWPSPNPAPLEFSRQTKIDNDDERLPMDGVLEEGWPTIKKADAKPSNVKTSPHATASPWGGSQQFDSIPNAQATKETPITKTTATPVTSTRGHPHHHTVAGKATTWQPKSQSKEHHTWDAGGSAWHTSAHDAWGAEGDSESESESEFGADAEDGWGAWDRPAPAGKALKLSAATTPAASAWRSWGEEAKRNSRANSFFAPASGSRNDISSQQRSQILDSFLNVPQSQNGYVAQHKQAQTTVQPATKHFPHGHTTSTQQHIAYRHSPSQRHSIQPQSKLFPHIPPEQPSQSNWWHTDAQQNMKQETKPIKDGRRGKHQRAQSENHRGWDELGGGGGGGGNDWWTAAQSRGTDSYGWGPIPEEDEEDYEDARRVHFSPKPPSMNLWGDGGKSPLWGGGKPGKAEPIHVWGTDGDGWVGKSDKTNGWGSKSPQGNSSWGAWGDDKSQFDSPWGVGLKDEDAPWHSLLERPKGKAPSILSARPQDRHSETSYSMPSRTLAHAYKGTTTTLHAAGPESSIIGDFMDVPILDSGREALEPVQRALFGKGRRARERIHWMFPPDKDERVESLLTWIQNLSYSLATYGVHKFLQTRERGALFANADFRLPGKESLPAFDWLTFDELRRTRDKILQESVVFYDPAVLVIVFVFLPSSTGNSVAMWRRKIPVPNNTRLSFQAHINQALAGLRRDSDYIVHVDELPNEMSSITRSKSLPAALPSVSGRKKKKRKWWRALFGL